MARRARLKVRGEPAVYHIISRTVGQQFLLGRKEKGYFLHLLERLGRKYFVEIISFAILDNHFHLIIRIRPGDGVPAPEIRKRYYEYYGMKKPFPEERLEHFRRKWGDLSEFVRDLKQNFSRWYNKTHNRSGYLWGGRFTSVLLEKGEALVSCMAYVDLNPVRARIVVSPQDYPWSSIGCLVRETCTETFLHPEISGLGGDQATFLQQYLALLSGVLQAGSSLSPAKIDDADRSLCPVGADLLLQRVRHYAEGLVVGSHQFVRSMGDYFSAQLKIKRHRNPVAVGNDAFFSLKQVYGPPPASPPRPTPPAIP